MVKFSRRQIRIFFIWIILSLILQLSFYAIVDDKLSYSLDPSSKVKEIVIPTTDVIKPRLSPSQKYFSYYANQSLEVYDLTRNKIVYQKPAMAEGKVIGFNWLPDRDQLVFIYQGTLEPSENDTSMLHLYSLEFNPVEETPWEHYNGTINSVLENATVEHMAFSTFTNIMYLVFSSHENTVLLEVDVMKNTKTISRSQEKVINIAVSEKSGILYLESHLPPNSKRIYAVNGWNRRVVVADPHTHLLGYHGEQLYVGKLTDNMLTEILTLPENGQSQTGVFWKGNIHYNDNIQFKILNSDKVIILSQQYLYIIENGIATKLVCSGKDNYLTDDGRYLLNIIREKNYSRIKLIPVESLEEAKN